MMRLSLYFTVTRHYKLQEQRTTTNLGHNFRQSTFYDSAILSEEL